MLLMACVPCSEEHWALAEWVGSYTPFALVPLAMAGELTMRTVRVLRAADETDGAAVARKRR